MEYLRVKVLPGSHKNEISEVLKDADGTETLKIRITAAPQKGKANAELINFLAQHFEVAKEKISIISGKNSQLKLIKISGLNKSIQN